MNTSRVRPLRVATALASARRTSEDRLLVEEGRSGVLVAVADGAGGLAGGARAADLLVSLVREASSSLLAARSPAEFSTLLRHADARIASDARAGETTAVVLVAASGYIVGSSVGDYEAWVVSPSAIDTLTARQTRKRLGSGDASPVAFERSSLEGRLVVGTDGLFGYASDARIGSVLRTHEPLECPEKLLALVRLGRGGYADDVAVAVVGQVPRRRSSSR